jgi:cytochrome c553
MKLIKSATAALTVVLFSATSFAGGFDETDLGEAIANRNCAWCHGQSGQGFSTAPRLAGQNRQYIEDQIKSFRFHTRDNPKSEQYMWAASAKIDAQAASEVAIYYSLVAPIAAEDGDQVATGEGRLTYRDGKIEMNIPSCVACHGPNAEGTGAIPRLAGLSYRYLKRRLVQWGEGYHLAAKAPMPEVAKNLPPQEIEALASYLSFLK